MERIVKLLFCFGLFFSIGFGLPCFAEGETTQTVVQNPELLDCVRTYNIPYDKLFYLTLTGVTENNFELKEMQTKSGYIIFETGYRKFLASIVYVSASKSMLKITPYSGNYDFKPEVPKKMFAYIETYQNVKF